MSTWEGSKVSMIAAIAALAVLSVQSPVLAQTSSISFARTQSSSLNAIFKLVENSGPDNEQDSTSHGKSINPKLKMPLHQVPGLCMINRDV
jgi:hypothetical protein